MTKTHLNSDENHVSHVLYNMVRAIYARILRCTSGGFASASGYSAESDYKEVAFVEVI